MKAVEVHEQLLPVVQHGFRVFPVQVRGKKPLLDKWPERASANPDQVSDWLQQYGPDINWGLACGPASDLLVLDVDGEEGFESLKAFAEKGWTLPEETLRVKTSRGQHIYFRFPDGHEGRSSAGKLAPGLDIRGKGGYVVIPPSVHESGAQYAFNGDPRMPLAPVPAWMLDEFSRLSREPQSDSAVANGAGRIPKGRRNNDLASLAGRMWKTGVAPEAVRAALLEQNRALCEPPLPEHEVIEIAKSITRYPRGSAPQEKLVLRPELITLTEIKAQNVDWLFKPYLALGTIAGVSGDPGAGKTTGSLSLAAGLTRGVLPGGEQCFPCNILYMSNENSPEYVLRPRFDALEGDPARFTILRGALVGEGEQIERRSISLSDVPLLDEAIRSTGAALVIVDPIQSYLGAEVDAHRANETRPVLDELIRLAEKYHCCILLVRHLSKAQAGHAIYRGLGSIDLSAAFRTELLVGHDPNDPTKRALIHLKSNIGPLGSSLGFEIGEAGEFSWTGKSSLTAGDVLSPEGSQEEMTMLQSAVEFLREELGTGPKPATEIVRAGEKVGISEITLRRARARLKIKSEKDGMGGPWMLSLPRGTPAPEGAHGSEGAQNLYVEKNDHLRDDTEGAHHDRLREWRRPEALFAEGDQGESHSGANENDERLRQGLKNERYMIPCDEHGASVGYWLDGNGDRVCAGCSAAPAGVAVLGKEGEL